MSALHGVCFSTTGLAISENADIKAIKGALD
jgi:hypothetical protein